ncbi:hypothetical protein IDH44_19805 [Paenibacillus sp. IB182496]|uniref:Uncharacterized protein n=1 Tax=Paenibacillus sabuli TaxID=2772509 RepID=A0A927GT55_9BACL|nr:hypothetical protein [Paenibacillus sabuli]MBD2847454.1 hypothetical protein [Paenibacillus sabuli]
MVPVSIEKFATLHMKHNPKESKKNLIESLEAAVSAKENGACCGQCGQPIWAVGTAIAGWNSCFTCLTGEADHSDDYEIDQVC